MADIWDFLDANMDLPLDNSQMSEFLLTLKGLTQDQRDNIHILMSDINTPTILTPALVLRQLIIGNDKLISCITVNIPSNQINVSSYSGVHDTLKLIRKSILQG